MGKHLALFVFILFSAHSFSQSIDSLDGIHEDVRGIHTFIYTIHPGLPTYVFHLIGDSANNTITKIEISKGEDPKIVQSIDIIMEEAPYREANYFQLQDSNFDGYQDIQLLDWWGATGNTGFRFWLFDTITGTFIYNDQLGELVSPVFDPKTQVITTFATGGMAGMVHTAQKYTYQDGKLILIEEEVQDWIEIEKHFLRTIKVLMNGAMIDSLKEVIVDDNCK